MLLRPLAVAALFALVLSAAPASAQILFSMDNSASAAPNHGFDGVWQTPGCSTMTHVPGGGPSGADAVNWEYLPDAPQGQFYLGWEKTIDASGDWPLGATRYLRWRLKLTGDLDAGNQALTNKHVIVEGLHNGELGVMHRDRFMINWHAVSATGFVVRVHMTDNWNIAGPEFPLDQWQNVQVMVRLSSALDVRDGGYKLWVNNDDENAPDADSWVQHGDAWLGDFHDDSASGGIPIGGHGMGVHQFGFYANEALNSGHSRGMWVSDYTVAESFDPSWSLGGTGGGSAASSGGSTGSSGAGTGGGTGGGPAGFGGVGTSGTAGGGAAASGEGGAGGAAADRGGGEADSGCAFRAARGDGTPACALLAALALLVFSRAAAARARTRSLS